MMMDGRIETVGIQVSDLRGAVLSANDGGNLLDQPFLESHIGRDTQPEIDNRCPDDTLIY
jgi:hypothetical protein